MDSRCKTRHHDYDEGGRCKRAGCTATRRGPGGIEIPPPAQPAPQAPAQPAPPAQAPAQPAPQAPRPHPLLSLVPELPAATAKIDQATEKEPEKKSDGTDWISPAIVGGVVTANHWAIRRWGLIPPEVEPKKLDKANDAVGSWIRSKYGDLPKLSPFWEMVIALGGLVLASWMSARKPTQADQSSPTAAGLKIPTRTAAAPSTPAPDATKAPPSPTPVAGIAATTTAATPFTTHPGASLLDGTEVPSGAALDAAASIPAAPRGADHVQAA